MQQAVLTCQVTHLYASTNDNYTPIMLPHTVLADVDGSLPCPCMLVMPAALHTPHLSFLTGKAVFFMDLLIGSAKCNKGMPQLESKTRLHCTRSHGQPKFPFAAPRKRAEHNADEKQTVYLQS